MKTSKRRRPAFCWRAPEILVIGIGIGIGDIGYFVNVNTQPCHRQPFLEWRAESGSCVLSSLCTNHRARHLKCKTNHRLFIFFTFFIIYIFSSLCTNHRLFLFLFFYFYYYFFYLFILFFFYLFIFIFYFFIYFLFIFYFFLFIYLFIYWIG